MSKKYCRMLAATYTGPMTQDEWVEKYLPHLETTISQRALGNPGAVSFKMFVVEGVVSGGGSLEGLNPEGGFTIFSITEYDSEKNRQAATEAEATSEFRFAQLRLVETTPLFAAMLYQFLEASRD